MKAFFFETRQKETRAARTHRPSPLSTHPPGYFSQFGTVTRVRVSRNKKTARARHYAFLEFASPAVAKVAADAMDGYLLFTSRLAAKVVPPSRVHPALFKGANRTFTRVPWRKIEAERHNVERDGDKEKVRASRAAARDRKRAARIKAAGLDYEYDVLAADAVPATPEVKAVAAKAKKGAETKTKTPAPPPTRGVRKRTAGAEAAPQPAAKVGAVAKQAVAQKKKAAPVAAAPRAKRATAGAPAAASKKRTKKA